MLFSLYILNAICICINSGTKRITRMVVYFTLDEKATRLWFRWCTCLRVEHREQGIGFAKSQNLIVTSLVARDAGTGGHDTKDRYRVEAQHRALDMGSCTEEDEEEENEGTAVEIAEQDMGSLDTPSARSTMRRDRQFYSHDQVVDGMYHIPPNRSFLCPLCNSYYGIETGIPVQHSIVLRAGTEILESRRRQQKTHRHASVGDIGISNGDVSSDSDMRDFGSSASTSSSSDAMSSKSNGGSSAAHQLETHAASFQVDASRTGQRMATVSSFESPDVSREILLCETCCLLCNDEVMNGLAKTEEPLREEGTMRNGRLCANEKKKSTRSTSSRSSQRGSSAGRRVAFGTSGSFAIRHIPVMPVRTLSSLDRGGSSSAHGGQGAKNSTRPTPVPRCAFQQTASLRHRFDARDSSATDDDGRSSSSSSSVSGGERYARDEEKVQASFHDIYGNSRGKKATKNDIVSTCLTSTLSTKYAHRSYQSYSARRIGRSKSSSSSSLQSTRHHAGPPSESGLTSTEAAFLSQIIAQNPDPPEE